MPFRGHREDAESHNRGLYSELVQFTAAARNEVFKDHFKFGSLVNQEVPQTIDDHSPSPSLANNSGCDWSLTNSHNFHLLL